MAHVERRMYRRRRKRAKRIRLAVIVLGLAAAAVLIVHCSRKPAMIAEYIAKPTATPVANAFDQTVATREVRLAARIWYAIQTGVFSTQEAAIEKADAYASRGAPGTVVQDGAKWRVFIACYGSESEASAVRQRLGESQRVETYLYHWSCPELCLRLTGMAGQLDIVEAGLTLICQAPETLRDTAILLDAGELTTAEASRMVAELDGQITLWAETARARFGSQKPDLLMKLYAITDGWNGRRKALESAAGSATTLSAALKGQGIAMFDDAIALRCAVEAGK